MDEREQRLGSTFNYELPSISTIATWDEIPVVCEDVVPRRLVKAGIDGLDKRWVVN
jgi:hypothetical protein